MNDLKFAFRQLLKNPGFTAMAVLTLGIVVPFPCWLAPQLNALAVRRDLG